MEAVRPKNPGMGAMPQRRGGVVGDTVTGGGATRRMNAIKHNHPGALENKLNRIGKLSSHCNGTYKFLLTLCYQY